MSSYYDFRWATLEFDSARNKQAGKPLENNTRLFKRSDDSFAVKLHAVDVVTINSDGTYTLRNGGWNTVTTLSRIRNYAPVHGTLHSDKGEWYVRLTPDKNDPRPQRVEREVPKPFHAENPGPEPVKNEEGCIANQLVTTEHVDEVVECWRNDMKDGDELIEVISEYDSNHDYDKVKVKRSFDTHVWVGEGAQAYQDEGWREFTGSTWGTSYRINDDEQVTYVQCSHCKDFDTVHENWRYRMYGDRWSRRFDEPGGYSVYTDMMERYGTEEAWQKAYLTDLRERRAYLAEEREWDERNRVPFYDGIIVDDLGFAQRNRKSGPSRSKLAKHERKVAKVKAQIDKYVTGYIAELSKGTMPMPSNGDCWYCLFRNTKTGETWGDMGDKGDHLWSHFEDDYYVPSLAVNALRERGYRDVGIAMWLDMDFDAQTMGKPDGRYDGVKRDLVKYLSKRLIPQAPTK